MTIIKTEINGQPFEITVDDGLNMEFTENSLRVTKRVEWYTYPNVNNGWYQITSQPELPSGGLKAT